MNVLVIGGTLFIGRPLVAGLLKAGHQVTVMHRRNGHTLGRRVGEIVADRNDPAAVRPSLAGTHFDIVFDNVYDWERGTTARMWRPRRRLAATGCGATFSCPAWGLR